MNLPEFGVRRPITNLMIFSCIIILSLYSITRLGIDMMPEIEPPVISVVSAYNGASPEDVEIKVTKPLEDQFATTPGIEKITSFSMEGFSIISAKFIWGTDLTEASNDLRDRIELAKRFLPDIPDEMENPFIFKFNTSMIPILFVGVTAEQNYTSLYNMMDKYVGDALRQIPGVGAVQLRGGLERQINVWIDRKRLEGYGFSVLDIQNVLRQENITQPVGSIKSGLTDYLLRLPGEFKNPEEVNSVILGKRNGKLIYLKDVAIVEDSFKEDTYITRINEHPGIIMTIQKQSGSNTVQVAEKVKKKLNDLQKNLPPDVKMRIITDTSSDIVSALKSLKSTVWNAILLVVIVVWFFLRFFLPSLIIALTIPFSLLIAFIYLFLVGKTINVISLSSLAITTGMVVDNAIVIVDNVYRHMEKGKRVQEASIYGSTEMFLAIAASTLTTVVVFLPMLFVSGVVGIMFGELAVIVTVTLIASLFTAATFTPMLCSKWMRSEMFQNNKTNNNTGFKGLVKTWHRKFYNFSESIFISWENFYGKLLAWCLSRKKVVIFGFFGVFVASLFLTKFVGNEFIPEEDSGDLRITASLPVGTRLEETDMVAKQIETIIKDTVPEARIAYVGSGQAQGMGRVFGRSSGTHVTSDGIKLVPKQERKRSDREIAQGLRNKIKNIPGIMKIDVTSGNPIGRMITGTGGKAIQVEVIGHSFSDTDNVAEKVREIIEKTPGTVDISTSRELSRPELRIEVDREKASSLSINMSTIANSIKALVEGVTATKYREKGETYDIYIRLEESSRSSPEDIENISIVSPYTNKQIKLSNFAKVYETKGPIDIERKNRERVVKVECNTHGRSSGKVIEDIKKELQNIVLPMDIMVNFGGEAEEQAMAFKDLTLLLLLGICLVYMVMAAQFESLLDPFIVIFAIPFTFTGVILGFIVTKTTLSVVTFLGIVMLMGIVVNNAIVLISYINILRERGLSMLEAVTTGGRHRLRAVLMTTITTLVGLLPMALSKGEGSETWQPLGITMISGLSVSTIITMLFVPTLYAAFETRKKNK